MIHRSHLILMPAESLCGEAKETLFKARQLYMFIFNKNSGQVTGMAHLGTLIRCDPWKRLSEAAKPMVLVSSNKKVAEAIKLLFDKDVSECGIIDEYGSFCGVFSLSGGLRSIMTPLFNASHREEVATEGKTRLFNGETLIESMSGWLPSSLEKRASQARTFNGLLTGYLGFIPQSGDKFAIDGWKFYIIAATPTKIESVLIKKGKDYEC